MRVISVYDITDIKMRLPLKVTLPAAKTVELNS